MKQQGRLIAATLFAAAIMSTLPGYLVMPVSDSVRPALLIKLPWMAPKKGDYVTFELHNKKLPNGHAFLTKRIGCTSGDNLENRAGAFFCNGDYMVTALDKDGYGNALSQYRVNGIIPDNKAFVIGDNPSSYDSRYWGLIPINSATYSFPIF